MDLKEVKLSDFTQIFEDVKKYMFVSISDDEKSCRIGFIFENMNTVFQDFSASQLLDNIGFLTDIYVKLKEKDFSDVLNEKQILQKQEEILGELSDVAKLDGYSITSKESEVSEKQNKKSKTRSKVSKKTTPKKSLKNSVKRKTKK